MNCVCARRGSALRCALRWPPSRSPAICSAPPRSPAMQDSNLKPALPGALEGVGIDQRLDQQIPLDLHVQG